MKDHPPDPSAGWARTNEPHPAETTVVVATLRALLRVASRPDAALVLQDAVVRLGGEVVAAQDAVESDLPADVSLGVGEPLVVRPPDDRRTAQYLTSHLAALVEDAGWAAMRCDRHSREAVRATTDSLTKVASRAEIGPRLGATGIGDAVCVLDLDHFKQLNDTRGHHAGDATLRQFGSLLLEHVRDDDFVGRSGGDEFVVVMRGTTATAAGERMRRLAALWRESGDHGTSVSVGVAAVDRRGGVAAARAADEAMFRGKRSGRGRVEAGW